MRVWWRCLHLRACQQVAFHEDYTVAKPGLVLQAVHHARPVERKAAGQPKGRSEATAIYRCSTPSMARFWLKFCQRLLSDLANVWVCGCRPQYVSNVWKATITITQQTRHN